jgi:DNA-binding FadR family transcriptional regulator
VPASDVSDELFLEPIMPVQLYEQIADRIRERIRGGIWKPGDRLPSERELARAFAVSRPSLREAIAALQVDGVLETRPGLGSFVAAKAKHALAERTRSPEEHASHDMSPLALLDVREPLEEAIARIAAQRRATDPMAVKCLDSMRQNDDPSDPAQRAIWSDADRLFHRQLGWMTANPMIEHICDYVAQVMDQPLWRRLRDEALSQPGRSETYVREHDSIYEAIESGDIEAASFFAGHHVRTVRRNMGLA